MYAQLLNGKIIGVFGSDQDPDYWPGVVYLEPDDPDLVAWLKKFSVRGQ